MLIGSQFSQSHETRQKINEKKPKKNIVEYNTKKSKKRLWVCDNYV